MTGERLVLYSCAILDCLPIDRRRVKEVAKGFGMSWPLRRFSSRHCGKLFQVLGGGHEQSDESDQKLEPHMIM